jgi:hypothetical protein
MEMHRRMDEWRVISQKISSLELYPCSTLLPGEFAAGVHPREAKLLAAVTGYYTVEELAALLRQPVLNVAKDLYGLVMAGHVVLKGVRSGKRPDLPGIPGPELEPRLQATVPEPMPVPEFMAELRPVPLAPRPPAAGPNDPVKLAKLTHFAQRIIQTAKAVLPQEHHDMLNRLLARANSQLVQGEGPEVVKNLALAVSRGAVDAGCDGDTVKTLNSHLKALFSR